MIKTLHKRGIRSHHMYTAGLGSIGLALASWALSTRLEEQGMDRADRWGIFVGEWAPTFFAIGVAMRLEEMREEGGGIPQQRGEMEERVGGRASHAMR
ncbi:hypothetical protein AB0C84_04255 [Actinomadura sp. NPDC048955]|uniref:hypothetical protein n=1 Tax=Actinomadura TaxID=1988 RepID=UPI002164A84D|nr:hypothetical protein [Actinomadura glauciflava]MCR3743934.1 hypothetical protein [Actinomadura glauciflava]